jgi:perosamine synthetase
MVPDGGRVVKLCIPYVDERELAQIAEVLASGHLAQGPKVAEFERRVADRVGSRHAFATSSCTTALHLSLVALGVGPGDEVLVADFTFPATGNVVAHQQAAVVLVDVDPVTFTMDPEDLRRKITPRSRAVLPVHAFGCPADMDRIMAVAAEFGLPVLEDAACALGATCGGRACGSIGTLGCFSFHPRKVITTGEGGMIVTDDDELADRVRLLRNHGGVAETFAYRYEAAGFNYRLSDILAAIGVAQMDKLDELLERRRLLAGRLRELLADVPAVRCPDDPPWGMHIFQSFVVLLDESIDRDRLVADLRRADIETTLGTYALHDQPYFQRQGGWATGQLPHSHAAYRHSLTLPLYHQMTDEDPATVVAALLKAIALQ